MRLGLLCGIGAGALWGLVFLAPQTLPAFSPLQLALGRYLAYGALALLCALPSLRRAALQGTWHGTWHGTWRFTGVLLRQVLAGNLVYYMLLAYGVQHAGIPPTTLIIGLIPLVISLWGSQAASAPPLKRLVWPLLLIVVGLLCLQADVFQAPPSNGQAWLGMLCAVGALASWSWYAVDNARFLQRHPEIDSQTWANWYGIGTGALSLLGLLVVQGWTGAPLLGLHGTQAGLDWTWFWQVNLSLALLASLLGNTFWNVAARRLPLTLSGQLIVFETLFALIYGFAVTQRWPRGFEILAMTCLLGGVIWAMRLHRAPKPDYTVGQTASLL